MKISSYVHNEVETPHKIHMVGWMGGWLVSFRKYSHFVAPPCKLGFSALLRIHDGAECGKKRRGINKLKLARFSTLLRIQEPGVKAQNYIGVGGRWDTAQKKCII